MSEVVLRVSPARPAQVRIQQAGIVGPRGASGPEAQALIAHIADPQPHPAYDLDMPDLTVLFENRLI